MLRCLPLIIVMTADFIAEALKVAKRSTIRTHKTGAVIYRSGSVITNGWSHTPHYTLSNGKRSIHAEIHALGRGRAKQLIGSRAAVATLTGKSGNTTLALPCLDCAIALRSAGIIEVYYTTGNHTYGLLDLRDERTFEGLKVYQPGD